MEGSSIVATSVGDTLAFEDPPRPAGLFLPAVALPLLRPSGLGRRVALSHPNPGDLSAFDLLHGQFVALEPD